jgi:hypothetical protein
MLKSSNAKYASELEYPWDSYFDIDISPYLHNKMISDLGCFNGGRGVAWFEKYKLYKLFGIDVSQTFIPGIQEILLHRITYVLEKQSNSSAKRMRVNEYHSNGDRK